MAAESSRQQRVGDHIQRELAQLIQSELSDPRVGMVSVTGVDVSRDFAHARVFVTVLSNSLSASGATPQGPHQAAGSLDELERQESVRALNRAAGHLRTLLARRLPMRTVPKLTFRYDSTISSGNRLSALIDEALAADRRGGS